MSAGTCFARASANMGWVAVHHNEAPVLGGEELPRHGDRYPQTLARDGTVVLRHGDGEVVP
eukprot:11157007-Lingulodinium_polyedra.AAC.1